MYNKLMRFKNIFPVLFILTVFVIFFIPQSDVDFGWHYKCGELLLSANGCIDNTFTYYLADYKWAYPSFLFDGLLFLTYNAFGFVGTSFISSILMSFFAFVLYKTSKLSKTVFIFFFFLATFFSLGVLKFGLRPQIFTLIFLMLFFVLLKRLNNRRLLLIPVLFFVWVNTHAGFFLGPLFLILFIFSELVLLLFKFIKKPNFQINYYYQNKTLKGLVLLVFVASIAILATFVNPFSYGVYGEIIRHSKTPLNMLIAEWTAPRPYVIGTMTFLYLVFILLQFYNRKLILFGTAVLTVALYLSITANRNVPIFFFSYLVFLEDLKLFSTKVDQTITFYGQKLLLNLFIVFILFFSPIIILNTIKASSLDYYCSNYDIKYPCKAIKFLEGKKVNIYNRYEWGGYLIWKLPKAKIYIDGRMPAWIDNGKSPYQVWLDIYQTKEGWNNKLDDLKTEYLLISPYTFIDLELTANPDKFLYKEVYRDSVSVLYERVDG